MGAVMDEAQEYAEGAAQDAWEQQFETDEGDMG
jgi:hypothetical protein